MKNGKALAFSNWQANWPLLSVVPEHTSVTPAPSTTVIVAPIIGSPVAAVTFRVVALAEEGELVLEDELPPPPPHATRMPSNRLRVDTRNTVDVFTGILISYEIYIG